MRRVRSQQETRSPEWRFRPGGRLEMSWAELDLIAKWLAGTWLALVIGTILVRMIGRRIILTGLLSVEKDAPFGLDRLQLLFFTLLFCAGYVLTALGKGRGDDLPDIPTIVLLVITGSHGTYLASKFLALKSIKEGRRE